MSPKRYKELKTLLFANDLRYEEIAGIIGHGYNYIADRIKGRRSFTLDDAYAILDALDEPHERLTELFPPGGVAR